MHEASGEGFPCKTERLELKSRDGYKDEAREGYNNDKEDEDEAGMRGKEEKLKLAGTVSAVEPILSVDWIEWNRVNGNGNEVCRRRFMEASPRGADRMKGLGRSEYLGAWKQLNLNGCSVLVKRLVSGDGSMDYVK
ncbi:hypothetical protein FB451DRAFT_1187902 [Mycena latifolia]|nr:hypothetical protein FB451DRAFT_1187902 [Mycena latifolia]